MLLMFVIDVKSVATWCRFSVSIIKDTEQFN